MMEAMNAGTIPVVIADGYELPLAEYVDWDSLALRFSLADVPRITEVLRAIPDAEADAMQRRVIAACDMYLCGNLMVDYGRALRILEARVAHTKDEGSQSQQSRQSDVWRAGDVGSLHKRR
ncbi:unnamed protein product [Phaeothamnion confervicola]